MRNFVRAFFICVIVFTGACAGIFIARNTIAAYVLRIALARAIGPDCRFERVEIGPRMFRLHYLSISLPGARITLSSLSISFDIRKRIVQSIDAGKAQITVYDSATLAAYITRMRSAEGGAAAVPLRCVPCRVNISRAIISITQKNIDVFFEIGITGTMAEPGFELNRGYMRAGKCKFGPVLVEGVDGDCQGNACRVTAARVNAGKFALESVRIPFTYSSGAVVISEFRHDYFGARAVFSGFIESKDMSTAAFELKAHNAALAAISNLFISPEECQITGLFTGSASGTFSRSGLRAIEGIFSSERGGTIVLKKKDVLSFLRAKLTDSAYKRLVDGFKNYTYNKGSIRLYTQDRDIVAHCVFESELFGCRDIPIYFHKEER